MVADVLDHAADHFQVVGQQALLDLGPEEVREDAAEVLVTGVGEERAAVGDHAHETAQQALVGERLQLPFHPVLLVEEPPAAAELHFSGRAAVLEIAEHGGDQVVVDRVVVVEDGLGQAVLLIEAVEEPGQRPGQIAIAHRSS